jgi:hypothetical protein
LFCTDEQEFPFPYQHQVTRAKTDLVQWKSGKGFSWSPADPPHHIFALNSTQAMCGRVHIGENLLLSAVWLLPASVPLLPSAYNISYYLFYVTFHEARLHEYCQEQAKLGTRWRRPYM